MIKVYLTWGQKKKGRKEGQTDLKRFHGANDFSLKHRSKNLVSVTAFLLSGEGLLIDECSPGASCNSRFLSPLIKIQKERRIFSPQVLTSTLGLSLMGFD